MSKKLISVQVNGRTVEKAVEPRTLLVHFLREELNLTGTHIGCETSHCGACTVDVDGQSIKSCTVLAVQCDGSEVRTVEGLASGGKLHPLQQAFIDHGGLQCGYCTPGMIMNAYGLLLADPHPSREKVVGAMEGNLCRCSAYKRILEAIESVAGKEGGRP